MFYREYQKWKDPSVSLEIVSKTMRHKSSRLTLYHYVQNFESLGIDNLQSLEVETIISQEVQKRIIDYV